jgi:hypothetical protein
MRHTSIIALAALLAWPAADALANPGHGKGHAYGRAKQADKDDHERRVQPRVVVRNQVVEVRRVRVAPVVVTRNRYIYPRYGANARYGAWSSLDLNRDGILERWEWPHSRSLFNAIDRNDDGVVSQWELRNSVR